jgi:hypothetical protein
MKSHVYVGWETVGNYFEISCDLFLDVEAIRVWYSSCCKYTRTSNLTRLGAPILLPMALNVHLVNTLRLLEKAVASFYLFSVMGFR